VVRAARRVPRDDVGSSARHLHPPLTLRR